MREAIRKLSPIPCIGCEYCLPCPDGAGRAYKYWIGDEAKAAQCIQCQECESKCPQEIVISEWMPVVE